MLGILIKLERINQNMSQEALCNGICTTSYLSKIENGQAICSNEMYELLFDALNIEYINDKALCEKFAVENKKFINYYTTFAFPENNIWKQDFLSLCKKMQYSIHGVDAILASLALKNHTTDKDIETISFMEKSLNNQQSVIYACIKSYYYFDKFCTEKAIDVLNKFAGNIALAYAFRCIIYFCHGEYNKAAAHGEEGYRLYAAEGHIYGMLECALYLASTYSNVRNNNLTKKWTQICYNLNAVIKNKQVEKSLLYNDGATLLMFGEYKKALPYLEKSMQIEAELLKTNTEYISDKLLLQKLSFAYALNFDAENANKFLEKLKKLLTENDEMLLCSVELIEYILSTNNFANTKQYCNLLETCFFAAEKEIPKGRQEFFGRFLLDAYKQTRQYKKAALFMEKYNISFLYS